MLKQNHSKKKSNIIYSYSSFYCIFITESIISLHILVWTIFFGPFSCGNKENWRLNQHEYG